MVEEIKKDAELRMSKTVEALRQDLQKVRTGRAHTSLLDHIMVTYYGAAMPINQVASVTVTDSRTLSVTPWEKKSIPDVEKAIMNANLGLNPVTSGDVIRVPLPPLTEERRRDMIKLVRSEGEGARVSVRNIRREANHDLKALIKDEHLAKDEEHRAEEAIQKLTDHYVGEVDQVLSQKEQDILEF